MFPLDLRVPKRNDEKKICTVGSGQPVLYDIGHRFVIVIAPADSEVRIYEIEYKKEM